MHFISAASILLLIPVLEARFVNKDVFINISNVTTSQEPFDVKGFLNGYGYPFESHDVITEDGYILGMHRVPHGKNDTPNGDESQKRPAVLVMHGLLSNSVDFLIMGPTQSLGMLLADMGYDVWLGNSRGNTWSRRHVSLDPDTDDAFWDYSFHEFGHYDDAAMIDYIVNATGQEKIFYIGHSQGTTQFFVLAASRPEYNDKIMLMSALAPIVFLDHMVNPVIQMLKPILPPLIDDLAERFHITELLPHIPEFTPIFKALCNKDSEYQDVCFELIFLFCGFDIDQMDRDAFPVIFDNLPAGTCIKDIQHYLQLIISGHFRPYDYGEKNLAVYSDEVPPDYDLGSITAPIALHYAANDFFASFIDIDRLADALPNLAVKNLVPYQRFSHLDFLFAKDAIDLCYRDVVNVMNTYLNKI